MKRVTLFAGHYGSGKTNLAVNFARFAKRQLSESGDGREVVVADLDIVNPYFRSKDSAEELQRDGVGLVVSEYANSNVDFPALPKEAYSLFPDDANGVAALPFVVVDVGGDDRGALALGRYAPAMLAEGNYEMYAVVNASRPLTRTPADAVEVLREIEASSSGLRFTALFNNTNLGSETTAATVLESMSFAESVASALGIGVIHTACRRDLAGELAGRVPDLFPIDLQRFYYQKAKGA